YDMETGRVIFGFEDKLAGGDQPSDRDFNDGIFLIDYGDAVDGQSVFVADQNGGIGAVVSDPDSTTLSSARVHIADGAQNGDLLRLVGFADANNDGVIDGTGVTLTRLSDVDLQFTGTATIETYTQLLNAI